MSVFCCTGHVGVPIACNYVKLIDVPEMEYYAKDGIGEVKWYCEAVFLSNKDKATT